MIAADTITALLAAIRAEPHNRLHRLMLADCLEEAGDRRFEEVRAMQPILNAVLERLGKEFVNKWRTSGRRNRAGRLPKPLKLFRSWLEEYSPLAPRAFLEAAEIERGLAVLRLFQE